MYGDIDFYDESDIKDILDIASTYVTLERCTGGRIMNASDSYVCFHCGADQSAGEECLDPKKKETS